METDELIRVYDGAPVPYSEGQLRMDIAPARAPAGPLPDDFLAEFDVFRPAQMPKPDTTEGFIAVIKSEPELVDGTWTYTWLIRAKNAAELATDLEAKKDEIRAERNRRLNMDFEFEGKMYQRDADGLGRITGAATLAGFALAAGAVAGDLRWANPDRDFGWIATDDTVTPMDAATCFAFGQKAASVETSIIFAAKALREMDPMPDDVTDDAHWS